MSLTQTDLQAIRGIVEEVVDVSMQQTAAGFAEVHAKIDRLDTKTDTLQGTVNRIERVQRAEVTRVDGQSTTIAKMRKALRKV